MSTILRSLIEALTGEANRTRTRLNAIESALNERDLFINPHLLEQAADEIDCGGECDHIRREGDTGYSWCKLSEDGAYCPNDVAETLRALAKVARANPPTEK